MDWFNQGAWKLESWKVGKLSDIEERSTCKFLLLETYSIKFYHNSVSGLKVETAKRDNHGKKRGGLEILIIL